MVRRALGMSEKRGAGAEMSHRLSYEKDIYYQK